MHGNLATAVGLVLLATAVAAVNAARFAADVPVSSVLFGEGRSPAIAALIESVGRGAGFRYGLPPRRAFVVLVAAIVVFYVVPLVLIVASIVVLVVAAIVLEYVPR